MIPRRRLRAPDWRPYVWPFLMYGLWPAACALRLVRGRTPPDVRFTEPDLFA